VDAAGLRSTLQTLEGRLGPSASAMVVDLDSGKTLFSNRPDLALAPASNQKLFTTTGGLLRFGPAATLDTTVLGAVDGDGVVRGDLYLRGGGDPTLGDSGLQALAQRVAAAGVRRIIGGVVGDESLFDGLRGGPDSAYRPDFDLGGWLSALSWRHGRARGGGPARAAAVRLNHYLAKEGIARGRRPRQGTAPVLAAAPTALATLASPPMSQLITDINVPSENFYAEMLIKALGARFGAGGSTAAGLDVVRGTLTPLGIQPRMVDGSGLSRVDATTSRQVVRLLVRMDGHELGATFRASLPVAGVSGTLRLRMRRTAAHTRCQAKTGTLIGVSALSGYCTATGGRRIAFSFLENRVCSSCAKRIEDRMVSAIARLSGAPATAPVTLDPVPTATTPATTPAPTPTGSTNTTPVTTTGDPGSLAGGTPPS
jgi:D-alanyl-D-alanine carboxypeptidase/D-alanyl-D-alanine-endopeptidase (penicillin-binding protein 4)